MIQSITSLGDVLYPSTLLTSAWVMLFLISSTIAGLLAPLEYLHRFILWWFDIERHPIKAIAKVAAALIVIGAAVFKVVQLA